MLSYDEAIARVTAPGERFETTQVDIRGITYTIFRNAPRSLRDIVATTRARGDAVFLVYEDERWTFSRVRVEGRRARECARRSVRDREGRSGRDRHAQLSRVGRRLQRHHVDRRHLGVVERVVDIRRARLRARRLRRQRAHRGRRAGRTQRGHVQAARHRRHRRPCAGSRPRQLTSGTTSSSRARRCPTSRSTPTTTPPSSTRQGRRDIRRVPCRRTARWCRH